MHSIERYGIVALLFLVVTVVAVLMWDGGKKKKEALAGSSTPPAQVMAQAPAFAPEPSAEEARARRLSLVAESQPGPLLRRPRAENPPAEGAVDEVPARAAAESPSTPTLAPLEQARDSGAALEAAKPPEEPARDPIVGRAATGTHPYSVRSGDTLSEIAQRELGSSRRWQEIVAANPGLDPSKLRVGKTIQIPGSKAGSQAPRTAAAPSITPAVGAKSEPVASNKTWKVGKGENLWRIAERALGDGKRWREIAVLNPKVNPDKLVLGQVLRLPGSSAELAKSKAKSKPAPATLVASSSEAGGAVRRGGKVK